jgi:SAC3 family protein LENG8/THP3
LVSKPLCQSATGLPSRHDEFESCTTKQQKTVDSKGPSSNILSTNHVSESFQPNLQGSMTTDTCSERKIQIPSNPRIAPGFSMSVPKIEKKNLGADITKKPAYVSISVPANDAKTSSMWP